LPPSKVHRRGNGRGTKTGPCRYQRPVTCSKALGAASALRRDPLDLDILLRHRLLPQPNGFDRVDKQALTHQTQSSQLGGRGPERGRRGFRERLFPPA
jgi:hypothetical protein